MTEILIVTAAFDATDGRWRATSRDVAGLCLMADSWPQLVERLPAMVKERLSSAPCRRREFSVEVLLHTSLSVTVERAAPYHLGVSTGRSRVTRDAVPIQVAAWNA